jgi:hypothetical protein
LAARIALTSRTLSWIGFRIEVCIGCFIDQYVQFRIPFSIVGYPAQPPPLNLDLNGRFSWR